VDKDFLTTSNSHTSITAGFALGDGRNIIARLPQAEVEVEGSAAHDVSPDQTRETISELPGLMVVSRNGQQFTARHVGLDALTGLSLLQVEGLALPSMRDANEETLRVGQRVRLFAPEPTNRAEETASGTLYLRVGEIEGEIAEITRSPGGKVARLRVRAHNLTQALVGGLVFSEAGEILGIVEWSSTSEARITPSSAARRAAERVLARGGSVPRPWLGVRGKELSGTTVAQLASNGWRSSRAAALVSKGHGIYLTSVAQGSAASAAGLRAGDVITRAGERDVISAQDFSLMLDEAGSGTQILLTVLRPERDAPYVVTVRLNESLNPAAATEMAEARAGHAQVTDPFIARGAETILLSQKAAANLGSEGGRLVVFVQPESAASRSGLRAGDLIESVDGRPLSMTASSSSRLSSAQLTLGIVREGKKLKLSLQK
jgi:serine protease Do